MIQRLKTMWALYKLSGHLLEAKDDFRAASMQIVVEGEGSVKERTRIATANGESPPDPRTACEVSFWFDVKKPSKVHRGLTLLDALENALQGG